MNIITLNRVLLNNTPLNYRRKRILTEKDFYFKTIERTFTFSKSAGGKSIKDGRAYIKRIKGNSVVWNQKFKHRNSTTNGITTTFQDGKYHSVGQLTANYFNIYQFDANELNHKYLFIAAGFSSSFTGRFALLNRAEKAPLSNGFGFIFMDNTDPSKSRYIGFDQMTIGDEIDETYSLVQYDLTQMFQAGNEPTTIEEFNARVATLGVDMYAYNEGEVIHCNTESIKSVGDNAWDEEWDFNYINYSTGQPTIGHTGGRICSANFIRVIPFAPYYFLLGGNMSYYVHKYDSDYNWLGEPLIVDSGNTITFDANVAYIKFASSNKYGEGTTYNHDIMLTLVHSGWKQDTDAGYQPYWQDTLPLPIIRKYFPDGMKSAGSAHDEIRYNKASGKWEYSKGKIKSVDMGTLIWNMAFAEQGYNVFLTGTFIAKYDNEGLNIINKKYTPAIVWMDSIKDKQCRLFASGEGVRLYVRDADYTDVASFKASLQGVILYYEAADWEWVELDAEDQNFRDYYQVADFGTEQSQSEVPSAALLADVGYYFKKSEVKELTLN